MMAVMEGTRTENACETTDNARRLRHGRDIAGSALVVQCSKSQISSSIGCWIHDIFPASTILVMVDDCVKLLSPVQQALTDLSNPTCQGELDDDQRGRVEIREG